MGAQLNIKDDETARLAREMASNSGKSVTATVRDALKRGQRDPQAEIAERIRKVNGLVDEFQRLLLDEWRGKTSKEIMDAIYDDEEKDGFAR